MLTLQATLHCDTDGCDESAPIEVLDPNRKPSGWYPSSGPPLPIGRPRTLPEGWQRLSWDYKYQCPDCVAKSQVAVQEAYKEARKRRDEIQFRMNELRASYEEFSSLSKELGKVERALTTLHKKLDLPEEDTLPEEFQVAD